MQDEFQKKLINTIRFLAADAIQQANSGHPGLPMGTAPSAFTIGRGTCGITQLTQPGKPGPIYPFRRARLYVTFMPCFTSLVTT